MDYPCKKSEVCWIIWRDAVGSGDRVHRDDVAQCGIIINRSLGWVAHEDESRVALAQGTSQTGELDILFIPIENITAREYPYKRRKK